MDVNQRISRISAHLNPRQVCMYIEYIISQTFDHVLLQQLLVIKLIFLCLIVL